MTDNPHKELLEAASWMLTVIRGTNASFDNGVEHNGLNEGEVIASKAVERLEAAIAAAAAPSERVDVEGLREKISNEIMVYMTHGIEPDPNGGPLNTADLAANAIIALPEIASLKAAVEEARGALERIKEVGTRTVTVRVGDAWSDTGWSDHEEVSDEAVIATEALAELSAPNPPRCHADRDGDCSWTGCPQLRDAEPGASGRHCPLDAATLSGETGTQSEPKPLPADAEPPVRFNMQGRCMTRCQADDDDYCEWAGCPQTRDNEPTATGRHCPLDVRGEEP